MNHKVIILEGLPGSGKSTFAKRLKEHYESIGYNVKSYFEGDLHPIDLAWCAILDSTMFFELLKKYRKYEDQILKQTKKVKGKYIVAFTKVKLDDEDASFYDLFSKYEIYREENLDSFFEAHLDLWSSFHSDDSLYIFECIFLQNHINELILKFNKSKEFMIEYFNKLIASISKTNPYLFYIKQKNIDETLKRIIEERGSDNPVYKDWIDLVDEYFQSTVFGEELGYIGREGVITYFKDRRDLELEIIPLLNMDSVVFELDDDYEEVFEEMKKVQI